MTTSRGPADLQLSEDYSAAVTLDFPAGLFNLISNNREPNIICRSSFSREILTFFYLIQNLKMLENFGVKKDAHVFIVAIRLLAKVFFKNLGVDYVVGAITISNALRHGHEVLAAGLANELFAPAKFDTFLKGLEKSLADTSKFV